MNVQIHYPKDSEAHNSEPLSRKPKTPSKSFEAVPVLQELEAAYTPDEDEDEVIVLICMGLGLSGLGLGRLVGVWGFCLVKCVVSCCFTPAL